MTPNSDTSLFMQTFQGGFSGILNWPGLDDLWSTLRQNPDRHYYLYTLDEPPPTSPASHAELDHFLHDLDALLRRQHQEDYCGIVYVNDSASPTFIKVYHPKRLGVVCGPGEGLVLPGWVLSTLAPVDLVATLTPGPPRPWWQRVLRS